MSKTIIQHYVPQFLLRNFCIPGEDKVFVFDKSNSRSFQTNIKNVVAERDYYEFSQGNSEFSLEESLSKIESSAKILLDKIIQARKLSVLSEDDCKTLSLFVAIQHLRGPRVRKDQEIIADSLRERFGDSPEGKKFLDKEWPNGEDHAKNFAIFFLGTQAHNHIQHFMNKTWYLLEAPKSAPFSISDNPVVLYNSNDFGPYGNLGLAVPGIQITFPISTDFALGFYCVSIENEFRKGIEKYNKMKMNPEVEKQFSSAIYTAKSFIEAAENGTPIKMTEENMLHLNSLQVGCASRFVLSSCNDFNLALDMMKKGHTNWGQIKVN